MRIEWKEETEQEPKKEKEPSLRDKHESDLTRKERRQLEREKLSEMSFGAKLEYIWAYYKAAIFGVIAVFVLISVTINTVENAKVKNVFGVLVIDSMMYDTEQAQQKTEEILGIADEKYQEAIVEGNIRTEEDGTSLDFYSNTALVTRVQSGTVDVIVMPESICKVLEKQNYFMDLKKVLSEEEYETFRDKIEKNHIAASSGELSELLEISYEPICVAVLVNARHPENAAKWIASFL